MDDLDDPQSSEDEILLPGGAKALRKSTDDKERGNWLDHAVNDSDCLFLGGTSSPPDCHLLNASQGGFSNSTTPLPVTINSSITTLPPHLRFDERSINDIAAYSVLFVIAAIGNLTVFITLFRNRHRKSRVNLMIMHLAAADLMVTLINFPIEVGWRITVQWLAGNLACKVLNFLRAFGLYLSSLVLVCISLDRYFAIVHPLKVNDAQRRGKMMLSFAWSIAAVCSIPQSVIFYEASHPQYKHFKQCVTFYFFETPVEERTYNVFCLVVMYFLPLLIIVVVYFRILWEISQKSKDSKESSSGRSGGREGRVRLRRSDMTNIERARARTLKMTVIIVLAFIICWTPYVVMVLWYMFDKQGAEQVQTSFQDALFIMAVSNSCVNPIVYGTYTINLRKELNRCFGRKTKPPVLARKSTVMTTQDGRGSKLQLRSSLSVLNQDDDVSGSTAMRTTVTAQLSGSNTLKMSTHTQVLPLENLSRSSSRRNHINSNVIRESPQSTHSCRRALNPASPTTASSTPSSFQVSSFSSSAKLSPEGHSATSPTLAHHHQPQQQPPMASGCVMLEIEVDVDDPLKDAASNNIAEDNYLKKIPKGVAEDNYLKRIPSVTAGNSSTDGDCFTIEPYSTCGEPSIHNNRRSFFSPSRITNRNGSSISRKNIHENLTEGIQLTSYTQLKETPPPVPHSKFPEVLEENLDGQPVGVGGMPVSHHLRKLSTDSGVFFESKQRKKSSNNNSSNPQVITRGLQDAVNNHQQIDSDQRHSPPKTHSNGNNIEMKCIKSPMNNL